MLWYTFRVTQLVIHIPRQIVPPTVCRESHSQISLPTRKWSGQVWGNNHKSVTQQDWDRRQSILIALYVCMFNKGATEHYIIEKVRTSVCTGGNPALYIHYKDKCQHCMRKVASLCRWQSSTANVREPSLVYVHHVNSFSPSQIIVAHLFPHIDVVPSLHIITVESKERWLWKFDVTHLQRCSTNWAFAASKRSCTFKVAICPTANKSFLAGAYIFFMDDCTFSKYVGPAHCTSSTWSCWWQTCKLECPCNVGCSAFIQHSVSTQLALSGTTQVIDFLHTGYLILSVFLLLRSGHGSILLLKTTHLPNGIGVP